jgi:3-oxoacyl-[acyl-carrier protein] reductase
VQKRSPAGLLEISPELTIDARCRARTDTLAIVPQSEEQKTRDLGAASQQTAWRTQGYYRCRFLTSDDAAFITGQAIVVDGGQYRIG